LSGLIARSRNRVILSAWSDAQTVYTTNNISVSLPNNDVNLYPAAWTGLVYTFPYAMRVRCLWRVNITTTVVGSNSLAYLLATNGLVIPGTPVDYQVIGYNGEAKTHVLECIFDVNGTGHRISPCVQNTSGAMRLLGSTVSGARAQLIIEEVNR